MRCKSDVNAEEEEEEDNDNVNTNVVINCNHLDDVPENRYERFAKNLGACRRKPWPRFVDVDGDDENTFKTIVISFFVNRSNDD